MLAYRILIISFKNFNKFYFPLIILIGIFYSVSSVYGETPDISQQNSLVLEPIPLQTIVIETDNPNFQTFDFVLNIIPEEQKITKSQYASFVINVESDGTQTGEVGLEIITDPDAFSSIKLNPKKGSSPLKSVLLLYPNENVIGNFEVLIRASNNIITEEKTIIVNIVNEKNSLFFDIIVGIVIVISFTLLVLITQNKISLIQKIFKKNT